MAAAFTACACVFGTNARGEARGETVVLCVDDDAPPGGDGLT